ncbi:lipid-A-disaccharide synthase N-terminal domain-containing protein [Sinomicrobium weinanense]|uniref:Lipid-A-disaccharide synthase N-terminal domain-containing protein n=1 Tax=Sinomicrobium weinanense TaxID=2842200 RepID=A0A926Q2F4_9FLAO|nr:lipid-A-disaccharide synthase N-terminal domain-containing protein [Sinomicrobium weinanense]MBC9796597.1 lipid-A-disaccharide synthase N-terminal domain-containing protein [Sinomicrobium weinanense]MBU3123581.1 lipid-A-disaccharide synthase N-terminal domain-containing protein [Sinomicrobium weinanense]
MQDWIIYSIGFFAQILFSARLLLQWILSEKSKTVLTPRFFWQLSLLASFLLFIYGYLRHDFAIMLGQTLTYFIYIRNIQIQGEWKKFPWAFRTFLWLFPFLMVIYYYNNNKFDLQNLFQNDNIPLWLLLLGSVAQVIFTFRFVYQWIYSEKRKESSLPRGFWVLSLTGALLILSYAILRKDPVLLIGHLFGSVIYIRNLMILNKQHD